MSTINELTWQSLSTAVNEMAAPNRFLQRLLYSRHQTLPTESIELSVITASRTIAPFIRKNGQAILVNGTGVKFSTVEAPNIRIKQPVTPSQYLFARQPGSSVHLLPGSTQVSEVRRHIARDLQYMEDMIQNAMEYLVALSLQGSIAYSVADGEVFTITIPRAAANNITLSVFWDTGGAAARPLQNIHTVKEVMADIPGSEGLTVTDGIMGTEAAHALLELVEAGHIKLLGLEGQQVNAGLMTFLEQFSGDGVIFLGMLGGVRLWQYGRTATLNGTAVNMIRPKYIEFISTSASSDRIMYFGAIPDMDAFDAGVLQAERFAKSWKEPDPSVMLALEHSRPLPWPRKPNATVSMKVVSG